MNLDWMDRDTVAKHLNANSWEDLQDWCLKNDINIDVYIIEKFSQLIEYTNK